MTTLITWGLATLTIVAQILFFLILYSAWRGNNKFSDFAVKHGLLICFIVALTSTLGSLYFSEILGWTPCKLCWYQRIFMYPLSVIFIVAYFSKDEDVFRYTTPLALIGGAIAIRHYYIQFIESASTSCGIEAVSCATKYTFLYGYITIPMMALSAFGLIVVIAMAKVWHRG